ncbi:MAG TPA: WD40 repeat domain-containing protein [Pyrinomonadaceae bacterium]
MITANHNFGTITHAEIRADLKKWLRFVQGESHVLKKRPSLLFQQAANQSGSTVPARAAKQRLESRLESRPWLRWVNKPRAVSNRLMVLAGHQDWVNQAAYSPDGTRIVSASDDNTMKLWDAASGQEMATITGRDGIQIKSCAFTPDGSRIVSRSWGQRPVDRKLRLWDGKTGDEIGVLADDFLITETPWSFSKDGREILVARNDHLTVSDSGTGKMLARLARHKDELTVWAYSPDGSKIVSASKDQTLKLWDAKSYDEIVTLKGHSGAIECCAFSPEGARIVSGSKDGALILWDTATGQQVLTLKDDVKVTHCGFSFDGKQMLSATAEAVLTVWDSETGAPIASLKGHGSAIKRCEFSRDGSRIISSCGQTLRLWDATTGAAIATMSYWIRTKNYGENVTEWCLSPDDSRILSGWSDGSLIVWDAKTGDKISTLTGHTFQIVSCLYSPDGKWILSAADQSLRVWDAVADQGSEEQSGRGPVAQLLFSPEASRIVSVAAEQAEGSAKVWDGQSGDNLATLVCGSVSIFDLSFSPDGERLVAGCNNSLQLWDVTRGERIEVLHASTKSGLENYQQHIYACAYSPDGSRIAAVDAEGLKLWDAVRMKELMSQGITGLTDCAFSLDGRFLITVSAVNYRDPVSKIDLWDSTARNHLATLSNQLFNVRAIAFSPDGSRLLSAGGKHEQFLAWNGVRNEMLWDSKSELKLWDLRSHKEIATLSGHSAAVFDCAFSPDGKHMLTTGYDGALILWNAETRMITRKWVAHRGAFRAEFLADGKHVISSDKSSVRLWNLNSHAEICCWIADFSGALSVSTVDGRIALGTVQNSVVLLKTENVKVGPMIVTAVRRPSRLSLFSGKTLSVCCPACREQCKVSESQLGGEVSCAGCAALVKLNNFALNPE